MLLSLEEKIGTSSAAGELVFHVFGAIADFERRLIAERTKDGIAAVRARVSCPGDAHSIRTRPALPSSSSKQGYHPPKLPDSSGWGALRFTERWPSPV